MKKLINSFLVASIIVFSPGIHAQGHKPIGSAQFSNENIQRKNLNFSEAEAQGCEPQNPYEIATENPSPFLQDDSIIVPYQEETQTPNQEVATPTPSNVIPYNESTTPEAIPSDNDENEGTPVGQAASEGSKAAKKKQWQNIALATVAIAATVTALILIANNDGHRKD